MLLRVRAALHHLIISLRLPFCNCFSNNGQAVGSLVFIKWHHYVWCHFFFMLREFRDKSHLLCQLPRSGWSVGRAALGANSDLRCLSRTWEKLGRRPWPFYIWTICLVKPMDKTMPFVNSIYPYMSVCRLDHRCGKRKKTKSYGLEGLNALIRQGSSLRSQPCPTNEPTATR